MNKKKTSRMLPVGGALACALLLVAGPAIAVSTLFYEDFTSANGGLGCTTAVGINGYNGWVATNETQAPDIALCDVGDWPGSLTRKYLGVLSFNTDSNNRGYAYHTFSTPSNVWDASVETVLGCSQTWGDDTFALLDLEGMVDVGFTDNDYSLDVRDGSGYAMDQVTLSCNAAYRITVEMPSPTASTYDLTVVSLSDSTTVLSGNFDTQSTTTPGAIWVGVRVGTSADDGLALFDEVRVRHQI